MRGFISEELALDLYNSMIHPHFSYADVVYDACLIGLANKLQTHQNLALKTVLNVDRRFSTSELHARTGVQWLDSERKERCCIETFKGLNNLSSVNVNKLYVKRESERGLRSCNTVNFQAPVTRSRFGDGNFINRSEQYWRPLPDDVKCITKLGHFKSAIKKGNFYAHT